MHSRHGICGLRSIQSRRHALSLTASADPNIGRHDARPQRERETTVEPGGAVVLSNADPNSIIFPSPVRLFVLHLKPMALRPLLCDFDTLFVRAIPKRVEALRLLLDYIGRLYTLQLADPIVQQLAVTHVYDLAALAIGATHDATEVARDRGLRAARMGAIKADIRTNLARKALSINEVASQQRVTPRYIQMLFEGEGTTFTEFVLDERLMCAYRMLTDPRFADRLISTIAFDVGFADLSYFNHSFRRRFGDTPSEVRAEGPGISMPQEVGTSQALEQEHLASIDRLAPSIRCRSKAPTATCCT